MLNTAKKALYLTAFVIGLLVLTWAAVLFMAWMGWGVPVGI